MIVYVVLFYKYAKYTDWNDVAKIYIFKKNLKKNIRREFIKTIYFDLDDLVKATKI